MKIGSIEIIFIIIIHIQTPRIKFLPAILVLTICSFWFNIYDFLSMQPLLQTGKDIFLLDSS